MIRTLSPLHGRGLAKVKTAPHIHGTNFFLLGGGVSSLKRVVFSLSSKTILKHRLSALGTVVGKPCLSCRRISIFWLLLTELG